MGRKFLIVGSCGQVGNYLYHRAIKRNLQVEGTWYTVDLSKEGRPYLDITDRERTIDFLKASDPGVIIFPAFNPNVDFCETNPEETQAVNVDAIPPVLDFCRKKSIAFVYFSTDYVFDGEGGPYSEDARVDPISVYGRQKLTVENMIRESHQEHIIARITWVYGREFLGKNFVVKLLFALKEKKHVKIPSDQISNPTYAGNVADTVFDLLSRDFCGTVNVADRNLMSRYEFAKRVAIYHGFETEMIEPVKTEATGQKARRPLNGGFILDKVERILGRKMTELEESLQLMAADMEILKKQSERKYSDN